MKFRVVQSETDLIFNVIRLATLFVSISLCGFSFLIHLNVAQQVDPDDSDAERSVTDKALEAKSDLKDAPHSHLNQNGMMNVQRLPNGNDPTNLVSSHESPLSMGEILSSLDAGVPLPGPGAEHSVDRQSIKSNETMLHVKRSNI